MAETAPATAPAAEKTARPTRPDENEYQKKLVEAEKAHKVAMDRLVRPSRRLNGLSSRHACPH